MTTEDSGLLTDWASWVMDKAREVAAAGGRPCVGCEHIAIALLKAQGPAALSDALANRGVDINALVLDLEREIQTAP